MSVLDKAKENYAYGKHQTISVEIADQLFSENVGASAEQFVCTECGEYVTFVRRYGYNSYFKHGKKNDFTKDCDLRSTNQSYNSIYERLGLPMYIRKYIDGRYELCIGFYNINESLFDNLEKANLKITINPYGMNNYIKKSLSVIFNRSNFFMGMTTLQKIDFIAPRYTINYSLPHCEIMLKERWGDYAEGILQDGALFTFHDNGGRKIRINDEISTSTEYLYMCRNENLLERHCDTISYMNYGTISLQVNNSEVIYNVYKIILSPQNDHQFGALFKFCRDYFKVTLNYKPILFEALWPPVIEKEQQAFCIKHRENFFLLKSDDLDSVEVFSHNGPEFKVINGESLDKGTKLLSLDIPAEGLTITINEKYSSIHSMIRKFKGGIKTYRNSFDITDMKNNHLEEVTYNMPFEDCIKISTDSKSRILHVHNNNITQYIMNDAHKIMIDNLKIGDKILTVNNGIESILINFIQQVTNKSVICDEKVSSQLMMINGLSVKAPFWMKKLGVLLQEYPRTLKIIKSYIKNNAMPYKSEKFLLEILYRLKDGNLDDQK
ncbi:hypothetical protein [Paenibacillus sp. VTT E-133291]|uniref:hypothetical protein n=1 Tax=Paenibacillus sp. VTT E-133291 TaxID=1986223 RepID=UPI00117CF9EB|nr:hypothetical protein [Paenibacillus sp. VTT E-133291]